MATYRQRRQYQGALKIPKILRTSLVRQVMKVIIVGLVSYQTLRKAFPLPDRLEEATEGDPLVQVAPNKNVA